MALDGDDYDLYEVGGSEEPETESEETGPIFELTEELEDEPNLVFEMEKTEDGKRKVKKLAQQVLEDWEEGWESTEEYRRRAAERQSLFIGDLPLKKAPFENAANVHIPMYLENLSRICFRVEGEMFNDMRNVFTVEPVGPDDVDKAMLLTKHGNWQIRYQFPEFRRQMSRAILSFFNQGDVVTHSWWDAARQRNCHEVLTCDDFVIPYIHLTVHPDLSDVPYKIKVMDMYRHDLQRNRDSWAHVDKVLARELADLDDEPESLMRDNKARIDGVSKPTGQRVAPYRVLWYEGWTDVFTTDEKTQRDRFVQVIVDYHSRCVMKISIHELPNWEDKLRYERELSELQMYQQALTAHQQYVAPGGGLEQKQAQFQQATENAMLEGAPPPDEATLQQAAQALAPPPPPQLPAWVQEQKDEAMAAGVPDFDINTALPKSPRKEPINTFAHAVCIEPMLGSLGIGYGHIQADLNKAGNILMSQFIDSASLNNVKSYVVHSSIDFEKPFSHSPGAMNKARGATPEMIQNGIREMSPGQANPQMFDVINAILAWAQSSASAPDVLSGEPGKSGETAKGLMMRIEQANTQLSVPTRNFADNCLAQVLRNNALLNSKFMPEDQIINIINQYGGPEPIQVGRRMYERDYRTMMGADLRFASRAQRVSEADEITAMIGGFPQMQMNAPFLYAALSNSLRARGAEHMIPYLGPPPPPSGQPFNQPVMPAVAPGGAPPGEPAQAAPPQQG